ncbi:MAG: 4Fe-4S dicluster domain-containing protein [Desulfatiglans sp.]|jgi:heterodisulfide reductase subunit C|nr:4Fe-4S dicluster domain-containing protein [Thermodesulfobacteriota bacterium]MEE4352702.1 4Fe-4S dicluster domain-containing protein [Desulfatiglans sp.]
MFYNVALYISLIIFALGLIFKVSTWFRRSVGIAPQGITPWVRVTSAFKGILQTLFSEKIIVLVKAFVFDVLFQARILREDFLRWLMHMLIFVGFMLLLLMHAMDGIITEPLFADYYSTINPYMFLRDLFGFMVIVGIAIALYRRFILKVPRLTTNAMDHYAIIILAVIMLSGIFLEGIKISSYSEYQEMVEEYGDADDDELEALEALWVKEFAVVSPDVRAPFDEEVLALGREVHDMNCAECHSRPTWAFTGYAVAKITRSFAGGLDRAGTHTILWYIHFLACFVGLAYLPFSKMFHIIASPLSLLANAVMDKDKSDPANILTRQALEIDACTHCGTCNLRCSVGVALDKIGNLYVLPSEKMAFLKTYTSDNNVDDKVLSAIQEGVYLCTNCERCTVVCPVGINLKDLWYSVREDLTQKGPTPIILSPFSFFRGLYKNELSSVDYPKPLEETQKAIASKCGLINRHDKVIPLTPVNRAFKEKAVQSLQGNTYAYCFSCENCTTVCPVVENYENPQETLGLLPHQIMRSVGLGLKDLALGSEMLWDCLTCYQCQEHCPQGVKVTDVLYELKNLAVKEVTQG